MMFVSYASRSELKEYLKIDVTDNSQDALLDVLLLDSYNLLNKLLEVDTFNKTEDEVEEVDTIYIGGIFYARNRPVISLQTINGTTYTGTKDVDYAIQRKRKVIVNDMSTYLIGLDFPFVKIGYSYGYDRDLTGDTPGEGDTLPNDIKLLQKTLASGMYGKVDSQNWGNIKEYTLGEETVKFGGVGGEDDASTSYYKFKTLLDKYKKFDAI